MFDLVLEGSLWLVTLRSSLGDRFPPAVQPLVRAVPLTAVLPAWDAVACFLALRVLRRN